MVQKCLEGDEHAIANLQACYGPNLVSFLISTGATNDEARESVAILWTDCLVGQGGKLPALARYAGESSLQTWLNSVALNQLISRKRKEERLARLHENAASAQFEYAAPEGGDSEPGAASPMADFQMQDVPLLQLMKSAVETAFARCPAEDYVLLQLAYRDRILLAELAKMWGCSQAWVSRRLARTAAYIERCALEYIRAVDPWVELRWSDFMDMCRTVDPSFFFGE